MDEIEVKLVETEEEMEAAMGVRFRVFVAEQQVPAPRHPERSEGSTAAHLISQSSGGVARHHHGTWQILRRCGWLRMTEALRWAQNDRGAAAGSE